MLNTTQGFNPEPPPSRIHTLAHHANTGMTNFLRKLTHLTCSSLTWAKAVELTVLRSSHLAGIQVQPDDLIPSMQATRGRFWRAPSTRQV